MSTRVEAGERFIRACGTAVQALELYPPSHPTCRDAVADLVVAVLRLVEDGEAAPLFVVRGAFYVGSKLLPGASLAYPRVLEAFREAGITAVQVQPDATESDVELFLRLLRREIPTTTPILSIDVNGVEPSFAGPDLSVAPTETQGHELGTEALRRTVVRAGAGEPADLEMASRAVRTLVEDVVKDPARSLLLAAFRAHEPDALERSVGVAVLAIALGFALGLDRAKIDELGVGALLHDVGMLTVPKEVLERPGPLRDEDWERIRQHPVEGAGIILAGEEGLTHPAAAVALEHHAWYEGKGGYPTLPGGRRPSPGARIVAVAETYVTMTNDRPYRHASTPREALAALNAAAGTRFDPRVVGLLLDLLGAYPPGSVVRLRTGEVGVVLRPHPRHDDRPAVRVVTDPSGAPTEPHEIDTSEWDGYGYRWSIDRALSPHEVGLDVREAID
ncbi:MAG: HD-GYP domain-containing protein [Nitriliruptorales bacterium]